MDPEEVEESLRVIRRRVHPLSRTLRDGAPYPEELFQVLAEEGILGLLFPPDYGGRGRSHREWALQIEEISRVSATASAMVAYVQVVGMPLLLAGTEAQKCQWAAGLASGEMKGSFALSEPTTGSDATKLTTRAERHADGWLLNGEKRFHGNVGLADFTIVFARTGNRGSEVSAFIVPAGLEGVEVAHLDGMGMPGWQLGATRYHDVELPEEALLGREGTGFALAMATMDHSRASVAAQGVGVAQGAMDVALDWCLHRETFGHRLVDHQAIRFRLADLEAAIVAARGLAVDAAVGLDTGVEDQTKRSSIAKLVGTQTAMRVTTEAVQLLGGNGWLRSFPAERMMRDAKLLEIYDGTNEIQRMVIGRQLVEAAERREPLWPEVVEAAAGRSEFDSAAARDLATQGKRT